MLQSRNFSFFPVRGSTSGSPLADDFGAKESAEEESFPMHDMYALTVDSRCW